MSISLNRLSTESKYYPLFENLLETAFPAEERRPSDKQREFTDGNSKFSPMAVLDDEKFIGLITYWNLGDFIYVEHLATLPEVRGGGMGEKILKHLSDSTTLPIVLEVEPPTTDIATRRIGFYKRNGFTLWDKYRYIQPAYAEYLPDVPLLLMVKGNSDPEVAFEHFRNEIHINVYGRKTPLI